MEINRWTSQIENITADFVQSFEPLTPEQLNWKPNAQSWSIAQILDHLITINASYSPVIQSVRDASYKMPVTAKIGFLVSFFGKTILKSVQPDNKKKIKTFPLWEPNHSQLPPDILDRFVTHQTSLKDLIENSLDLIAEGVVISSPANRNIVYKLEIALDIIVAHERRHLSQAHRIQEMVARI